MFDDAVTSSLSGTASVAERDRARSTARSMAKNMSETEAKDQARSLDTLALTGPAPGTAPFNEMKMRIETMAPRNIVFLSDKALVNPEVAGELTANHLRALDEANRIPNQSDRRNIARTILSFGTDSAKKYVSTGPSAHLWA